MLGNIYLCQSLFKIILYYTTRFSAEEKAKRDPMHFLPFGQGPRQCIGMRLALQEIKMAAADLLRKFRFTATDNTPVS